MVKKTSNSFSRKLQDFTSNDVEAKLLDSNTSIKLPRQESGPQYRMHTYNTRKSLLNSQENFTNNIEKLDEFRMIQSKSNCPKLIKMKEPKINAQQQKKLDRERKNKLEI